MKKHIFKIIPALFFFLAIVSCEREENLGISRVTFYNDIEFIGDEVMTSPIGTPFQDPGVIAFEGEENVTENVIVSSDVDSNALGLYHINYSITNADGFEKSITRIVITTPVNDSGVDYSGVYTGDTRGEIISDGCTITKIGPSTYFASDFFGGVYCCGVRDYGSAYVMPTYFIVSDDNTTFMDIDNNSPWGPWFVTENAISGTTISHRVNVDPPPGLGFGFDVTLLKQ